MPKPEAVAVIGTGLIGGSIGLALRASGYRVFGFEPNEEARKVALERGCFDEAASLEECAKAEVVFVCVPPSLIASSLDELAKHKKANTILTDVGSVKAGAVEWLAQSQDPQFVPGHPMAGHEKSGPKFASAWMFRGARWILTPEKVTSKDAIKAVEELIKEMGATPVRLDAAKHDHAVAILSHLPHALAAVLVQMAGDLDSTEASGGSWRDLTRVGGVSPDLWTQIMTSNRVEVSKVLKEFQSKLHELESALEANDEKAIRQFFEEAVRAKEKHA